MLPKKSIVIVVAVAGTCWIVQCLSGWSDDQVSNGVSPVVVDTEKNTNLTTPAESLKAMRVPDGFQVTLFAAEPDVRQPIAMTTDERGRLWVAENDTYSERAVNFSDQFHDRIVCLEDTDGDGRFDRRIVFWDQASKLTSIEVGFGGVWALCAPNLLFIPDRDRDDKPDGEPIVVLNGWEDDAVRHNIVNGLKWGPDGWLYGRHGIKATSYPGRPEIPIEQRQRINCGIWRYHPVQRIVEVVARGTTNPWGMDWDDHGQAFFINTVIGHLWHVLPGAHYERMYGEDFNPHLYRLMPQTADHFHWDTTERWSDAREAGLSPSTNSAGGGHAHTGMMIYLGDNWPSEFRGNVLTVNLHGLRINRDALKRSGCAYVGKHKPDFLTTNDPWFRGVELLGGPDGGVYIADWCDVGECHENDGVHRSSGRIYKVTFGSAKPVHHIDLAKRSDEELAALQTHANDWFVRQARRILQERSAAGQPLAAARSALNAMLEKTAGIRHRLRALWCLHVTGGISEQGLLELTNDPNEHMRVWAMKLLIDGGPPSSRAAARFAELARDEQSGLVLLYVASALQSVDVESRWPIAKRLAARGELAGDAVFPLMTWYAVEPAVATSPSKATELLGECRIPLLRTFIARRLASLLASNPQALDPLLARMRRKAEPPTASDVLAGIADGLRGWRKAPKPANWDQFAEELLERAEPQLRARVTELSLVFGDGRAADRLLAIARSRKVTLAERRGAIGALVASRDEKVIPVLQSLLGERDMAADAVHGLAAFSHPRTPALIFKHFGAMYSHTQREAVNTLVARAEHARALLGAIAEGKIDRKLVTAFQIRQMHSFGDAEIDDKLRELWPDLRHSTADAMAKIAEIQSKLPTDLAAAADLAAGRATFRKVCSSCHKLFGEGAAIGPDLTGAQRGNLNFLLENIVAPSAQVADNYRMSIVVLSDGRIVNGVIVPGDGPTMTIQTATERLVVDRDDVELVKESKLSLMPERLLDVMPEHEVRDLLGFLMHRAPAAKSP